MAARPGRRSARCSASTRHSTGGWLRWGTAAGPCSPTWGAAGAWRSTTPDSRPPKRPATTPADLAHDHLRVGGFYAAGAAEPPAERRQPVDWPAVLGAVAQLVAHLHGMQG